MAFHDGWRLKGYYFAVFDVSGEQVAVPIGANESQKNAALEAVEVLWINRLAR